MYDKSIKDPEGFWAEQAERLDWTKKWDKVSNNDFTKAQIKWFEGGKLNVSYNCLDRHIKAGYGDQTALIWEGNDPNTDTSLSYSELLLEVSKFANILKGKVDILLCETMSSGLEAKCALNAALQVEADVWVSWTLHGNRPNQLPSGESVKEAFLALENLTPQSACVAYHQGYTHKSHLTF